MENKNTTIDNMNLNNNTKFGGIDNGR